jgi:hypothetical protein
MLLAGCAQESCFSPLARCRRPVTKISLTPSRSYYNDKSEAPMSFKISKRHITCSPEKQSSRTTLLDLSHQFQALCLSHKLRKWLNKLRPKSSSDLRGRPTRSGNTKISKSNYLRCRVYYRVGEWLCPGLSFLLSCNAHRRANGGRERANLELRISTPLQERPTWGGGAGVRSIHGSKYAQRLSNETIALPTCPSPPRSAQQQQRPSRS